MEPVPTRHIEAHSAHGRELAKRNQRLLYVLTALALGMSGFGFVLSKAYTLICGATGSQVRPNNAVVANGEAHPTGRVIEVFFEGKTFDNLPVRFTPQDEYQHAEVGVEQHNTYHVVNLSKRALHFRPIHLIDPPVAAKAFGMRVCFCFTDQTLAPGEARDFEVAYRFAPELHRNVAMVQICYSLHEIDDNAPAPDKATIEKRVAGEGAIVTPGFRPEDAP